MHDLKDGADIVQLIKKTKECAGEVILHTGEDWMRYPDGW